eukprot:6035815-Amphidinium_carterae.1
MYGHRGLVLQKSPLFAFCKQFGLHISASFEHKKYGEAAPHLLEVWKRRLQELFEHWEFHGRPSTYPTSSMHAMDESVVVLAQDIVMNPASRKRKADILRLLP